jgi:hypothetical protein
MRSLLSPPLFAALILAGCLAPASEESSPSGDAAVGEEVKVLDESKLVSPTEGARFVIKLPANASRVRLVLAFHGQPVAPEYKGPEECSSPPGTPVVTRGGSVRERHLCGALPAGEHTR